MFFAGLVYSSWALVCRSGQCPPVEVLDQYTPHQTSKLYAIDGRFIAELGLEKRTLVTLSEIPLTVQNAFIVTEDKRFYKHAGVDWYRVVGAAAKDFFTLSFSEGFSTITMQLARNVFPENLSREKTLFRKLKEVKVARQIEARYDKKKILELYLNQISLGNGAYGVETASQRYFGKSVRDLNIAEAALLAGLPKAPHRYNPRRNPDLATQRRNTIIELMRREGMISDADASLARAYPLQLADKTAAGETAPYFVEWIREQLDAQFGKQLYEQGLKVYTTLDLDMQTAAERSLERQIRNIEAGRWGKYNHETYEHYSARITGEVEATTPVSPYLQGAFVALDPRSGAVRAMVGGRDFYDSKFNRAVQALRQPGSTFKPIVYAAAIQNGRPPSYILDDSPLILDRPGSPTWTPQNYDLKYFGQIPLRKSLYESRNLSTIRLGMELGEQTVINEARNFGISTPIPPYPAIHIGAADVYPIELISAYSVFANLGVRATPNAIIRVENQRKETLWQPTPTHTQVMSAEEAWIMVDMMKDVIRRGTASGSVWGAGFTIPAGGKTGTTNDGTDVWFVGYTADLVAGLWMGLDRPQKIISNAQGGRLAAPAWTAFMTEIYRRKRAPPDWPRPSSIITRDIDFSTAQLQTPYCPRELVGSEVFIPGTEPTIECQKHTGPNSLEQNGGVTPYSPPPVDTFTRGSPRIVDPRTGNPRDISPTIGNPAPRIIPGAAPIPTGVRPKPRGDSSRFRIDTTHSRGDSNSVESSRSNSR